ncbi:MAG: serine/threonine protein phosphatase [Ruminococcaceae bacterium]|nr:serine/threonine protein phosphatase [Oscillospiraceae bacterium]
MAIYAISDLHLGLSCDKPMDIFGARWENYLETLQENWCKTIGPEDVVLLPGDLSWATYIDDAEADFQFLHSLPGKKLISKGNHDYWWETLNKLNNWLSAHGFEDIEFLHNTVRVIGNVAVCAAKGYPDTGQSDEDKKLYNREVSRLQLSLDMAKKSGAETIFVMLHYPPSSQSDFVRLMEEYKVSRCLYGHLHGRHHAMATIGEHNGILYHLVSADYLHFKPLLISD